MKKSKTKFSGMTLVEMIVALAVFAALALILVMMGNSVEKHSRAATDLNKRVAVEGPIAEAHNKNSSYLVDNKTEIMVGIAPASEGATAAVTVTMNASLYYIDPNSQNETDTDYSVIPDTDATANDYMFKYIEVTKPTGYVTAASTTETTTAP